MSTGRFIWAPQDSGLELVTREYHGDHNQEDHGNWADDNTNPGNTPRSGAQAQRRMARARQVEMIPGLVNKFPNVIHYTHDTTPNKLDDILKYGLDEGSFGALGKLEKTGYVTKDDLRVVVQTEIPTRADTTDRVVPDMMYYREDVADPQAAAVQNLINENPDLIGAWVSFADPIPVSWIKAVYVKGKQIYPKQYRTDAKLGFDLFEESPRWIPPPNFGSKLDDTRRFHYPGGQEHNQDDHGNWADGEAGDEGLKSVTKLDGALDEPDASGFHYHATTLENALDIGKQGAMVPHEPSFGTDQDAWPDGSTAKRSYFGTPQNIWQFAPEGGKPVALRVPRKAAKFKAESHTGDIYVSGNISADDIEIKTEKGWRKLKSMVPKDYADKRYHLEGTENDHDQSTHGNWAHGGGEGAGSADMKDEDGNWLSRDEYRAKMPNRLNWKEVAKLDGPWPDDIQKRYDAERKMEDAWNKAIREELSFGRMSPEKADELGYYLGVEKWADLPGTIYHVTTANDRVFAEGLKQSALGEWRVYTGKVVDLLDSSKPDVKLFRTGFEPRDALRAFDARSWLIKGVLDERLRYWTRLELFKHLEGGRTTIETVKRLREIFEPYIGSPGLSRGAQILEPYALENIIRTETAWAINQGRLAVAEASEDYIIGLEYSSVLDDRTTNICNYAGTGRADGTGDNPIRIRKDDERVPALTPPNHFQCRSTWIYLTVDDGEIKWSSDARIDRAVRMVQDGFA